MFIWNIPFGTLEHFIKSNDYIFQLQVKSKTVFHLRLFKFNISCHRVLFLLCVDNISKSDQVLRVLPAERLCTDEVAKIRIAKSKCACFSFSFCICHLFLPKLVLFCSFSNLMILGSQFLLLRIFEPFFFFFEYYFYFYSINVILINSWWRGITSNSWFVISYCNSFWALLLWVSAIHPKAME